MLKKIKQEVESLNKSVDLFIKDYIAGEIDETYLKKNN